MATDDFFRARLDTMIDLRHPMAVLAVKMPWPEIEAALAPALAHRDRKGRLLEGADLFGTTAQLAGAGVSPAGRPRLAKRVGLKLKLTHEREGKTLRRKAAGYAHAKQFKRLRKTLKRQRTILGSLLREVRRKMDGLAEQARAQLTVWLERAERIHAQRPHDKNKLYALHAPEVECIGKGKARKPYEFGVKVSLAVTHKHGLMVGARSFAGNPYDGHTLAAQLEQTTTLLQDIGTKPTTAIVDLGYRGVDADCAPVQVIRRGKYKTLTAQQRGWLRRRQAIEPAIGHAKADHRMDRCWLKGSEGDALHAVLCAAGFNIRWLLRAIARQAAKALFLVFSLLALYVGAAMLALIRALPKSRTAAGLDTVEFAPRSRLLPGFNLGYAMR